MTKDGVVKLLCPVRAKTILCPGVSIVLIGCVPRTRRVNYAANFCVQMGTEICSSTGSEPLM